MGVSGVTPSVGGSKTRRLRTDPRGVARGTASRSAAVEACPLGGVMPGSAGAEGGGVAGGRSAEPLEGRGVLCFRGGSGEGCEPAIGEKKSEGKTGTGGRRERREERGGGGAGGGGVEREEGGGRGEKGGGRGEEGKDREEKRETERGRAGDRIPSSSRRGPTMSSAGPAAPEGGTAGGEGGGCRSDSGREPPVDTASFSSRLRVARTSSRVAWRSLGPKCLLAQAAAMSKFWFQAGSGRRDNPSTLSTTVSR